MFHKESLGLWIWNDSTEPNFKELKDLGYHWVAVKAHDGGGLYNHPARITQIRNEAHAHGLMFGIWGYTYHPSDAHLAAGLCGHYGAAFYIADAEIEYEQATQPYSRMFAHTFRLFHPRMYAALSTFGRVDFHGGIDYKAWKENNFAFMPQAYENESSELAPEVCVEKALRFWKREEIQPTIGCYSGARGRVSSSRITESIKACRVRGANIWEASSVLRSELEALARTR